MKCRFLTTKIKVLAFFGLCCGLCSLFASPSSYALDDLVYTSSVSSGLCGGYGECYSQGYRYIIYRNSSFLMTGSYQTAGYLYFRNPARPSESWSQSLGNASPLIILSIPDSPYFNGFALESGWTVTISDHLPDDLVSCPECEECQVCPVIPENPYDEKLDNIVKAIYVCCATLLVIYFFYCIYRMIIKNSGVK